MSIFSIETGRGISAQEQGFGMGSAALEKTCKITLPNLPRELKGRFRLPSVFKNTRFLPVINSEIVIHGIGLAVISSPAAGLVFGMMTDNTSLLNHSFAALWVEGVVISATDALNNFAKLLKES